MKRVCIFYGYLEYSGNLVQFMAIWYILWPFGILESVLYICPRFAILNEEKSGNPGLYVCRQGS
jgi:hypothetical protein